MNKWKKYGFYFLLMGVFSDFLTPYVLGIFYPKLNQMTAVMSLFGDVGSPVRQAFLIWSVVAGMLYVLSLPAIYQTFKDISQPLACSTAFAIGAYGIGDCIFTGVFSVDTEQAQWTFSTWVHNIGSGIGYTGFLTFPLFLFLLYRKQGNPSQSRKYLWLWFISLFFAGIYGLTRIPQINDLPLLSQIGLWQRISFLFNYLPIVLFAVEQIKRNDVGT
ncbi:DUF998 domain-containing protein [Enterococcus sp. BWM-S5]|uniref:DUF998 domain-containing protein n=1 Tax=Enterococcus larvae TaxID=2794352 RepID=A0ABS4CLL7_9ENTE|nr:DUF998 domain-containing protein [Enterococcus larvae]MBP1047368.1 DUF998 domain-containing protein [Enterococcus larvae]